MKDYRLGNKIYELRIDKSLTQEDLALMLNISDKAISKWENGTSKPSIDNLRKLSTILDISLDELLEYDSETKSDKKIYKIVLTGGPCAGKTTAMNWIQNHFQKYGYKVLFIPEAATELINAGVTPWEMNNTINFQSIIMDMQLQKEKLYEESAKKLPYEKILIVCDRGLLDDKAYMSEKDFNYLLKNKGLTEIQARDSYDAVFHLVTSAKGAKEFYNLDNAARTETIEEAIRLDDLIISSWTGHPHFRIIENNNAFENKMKKLISEISCVLGEPEPYEIERKFLIEMPDLKYLEKIPNCEKVRIIQTYLKSPEGEEIRIRQRGKDGSYTYSKTRKIDISKMKRIEMETRLSKDEYINELFNADPTRGQIIKDRYLLSYNNQYFEIDIFPFWKEQAIAEIELTNEEDEIKFPDFIKIIQEVTDLEEYKNAEIAKMIKKQ